MDIVTIDLETYYDKQFSLSKMTTEAYIRDPRFQVIGVGIKVNDQEVDTYCGSDIGGFLNSLDYSKRAILCHNTAFDGAVLSWLYGIRPRLWLDTLSMARPAFRTTVGGSLKALASHFNLGAKGTEVVNALGKRREDFTEEEMARYMDYCANDVNLTYMLFNKLKVGFPPSELRVIDQTIRMYTEPKIVLDKNQLRQHLSSVKDNKQKLLDALGNAGNQEDIRKVLMSNAKFAELLTSMGVTPPMKTSARTGKETYASAKTDKGMTDLLEHPNPLVASLVVARMGIKSTIEETRTEALLAVADRGPLPIMLNYYGAHTGRFSGGDGLNLQNLPARKGKSIRRALAAPEGNVILGCDLSQIEARMLAWVAGQNDLVESFAKGRDVYCEFASEVYGREITPADKTERFVGKTCLAEGTPVLCERGWVPIEQVTLTDRVWDGEEWVNHAGSILNGLKKTLPLCGISLTPDHLVLCGTEWKQAKDVYQNDSLKSLLLEKGREHLPLQAISSETKGAYTTSLLSVTAIASSSLRGISTLHRWLKAVLVAPLGSRSGRPTVSSPTPCPIHSIGSDSLVGFPPPLVDAIIPRTHTISTTEPEDYQSTHSGETTEPSFLSTYRQSRGGIIQTLRWIGSTTVRATCRAISDLFVRKRTSRTEEQSENCKQRSRVYDILSAGPRNRFTVLSKNGPIIVHNCILGLGYQCGAVKFREMLRQAGVEIDEYEAQRIVYTYRNRYPQIVALWNKLGSGLSNILHGGELSVEPLLIQEGGILLPNKLQIKYPALRASQNKYEYLSEQRAYRAYMKGEEIADNKWVNIYGGKVTENVIQALARIVITHHMTQVVEQCPDAHVLFQVHDEIVMMTPEDKAESVMTEVVRIMSCPPAWAEGLPVACEAGYSNNYGDVERG